MYVITLATDPTRSGVLVPTDLNPGMPYLSHGFRTESLEMRPSFPLQKLMSKLSSRPVFKQTFILEGALVVTALHSCTVPSDSRSPEYLEGP